MSNGKVMLLALIAIFVPFGVFIAIYYVMKNKPFSSPLKMWHVTSPFGIRGGSMHKGVDLRAPLNTPIYAPADGIIERIWHDSLNGYGLRIKHAGNWITGYAHLNTYNPIIAQDMHVKRGDLVAYSGNTGSSTAPHLHFVIVNPLGVKVNPVDYVKV